MPATQRRLEVLGPRHEAILKALLRYHYLLGRQVSRLFYAPGSRTFALSTLKALTDAEYCQRIWLPKSGPRGSSPAVYTLAQRGIRHLKGAGIDLPRRLKPTEDQERSSFFLRHTLELNDFLISAEMLGRWAPEFRLAGFLHDREMKRRPVHVQGSDGRRVTVTPDAWLDIRIQGKFQACLAIELDRGTEEQRQWRRKVSALVAYANGPYQNEFQVRSLTIAVVTTTDEKRLSDLLKWTQEELMARQEQAQADLFMFSYLPPEAMDAQRVFLTPCWYQPFGDVPLALLDTDWAS